MADFRQDINRVSSSSRCLIEQILEGIVPLKDWYILPKWEYQQVKFFSSELTQQSLNRECLSSKCSTKAPAKCNTSIYVLIVICLQWRKWVGSNYQTFQKDSKKVIMSKCFDIDKLQNYFHICIIILVTKIALSRYIPDSM